MVLGLCDREVGAIVRRDVDYRIECDCGQAYTQTIPDVMQGDESRVKPHVCGACGSYNIRVWVKVYDGLSPVIRERLAKTKCVCEEPGHFNSGYKGILAHIEPDGVYASEVERCDVCKVYESDSEACLALLRFLEAKEKEVSK